MSGTTTARSRSKDPAAVALMGRLEAAWRDSRPVELEALLPRNSSADLATELICAELELRLHAGQDVDVTVYFARFPAVAGSPANKLAVLEWDVLTRLDLGRPPGSTSTPCGSGSSPRNSSASARPPRWPGCSPRPSSRARWASSAGTGC